MTLRRLDLLFKPLLGIEYLLHCPLKVHIQHFSGELFEGPPHIRFEQFNNLCGICAETPDTQIVVQKKWWELVSMIMAGGVWTSSRVLSAKLDISICFLIGTPWCAGLGDDNGKSTGCNMEWVPAFR